MAEDTVGSDKNTSEAESILLVGLKPFTDYSITVTCENAAGPGDTSRPLIIRTISARKYHSLTTYKAVKCLILCLFPAPVIPDDAILEIPEQPDGRKFVVIFSKPDDSTGPIRLGAVEKTDRQQNDYTVEVPHWATLININPSIRDRHVCS